MKNVLLSNNENGDQLVKMYVYLILFNFKWVIICVIKLVKKFVSSI